MAVRPIDGNELYRIEKLLDTDIIRQDKVALNLLEQVLYDIQHVPTLTPPNEPEYREYTCPKCHHTWLEDRDASDYPEYCPGCGDPLHKEENEPLTLEQLREMDGEPVWIVDVGPHKWYGPGWAIVDRDNCLVRTAKNWNPVFFERYGERLIAYRCPPEGEEDT